MSSRILVLFGTTEGHTAKVAEALAEALRLHGADVDVVRAKGAPGGGPHPEYYDAVIVAGSVHAGGYQRAVVRWVRRHAVSLGDRPTAFVSVCLAVLQRSEAIDRELAAILRRFFDKTRWQPDETKIVAGALPYTQYGWLKRWIMRRIVAKANGDTDTSRDYEYTDWDDLADFAKRVADRVQVPHPVAAAS